MYYYELSFNPDFTPKPLLHRDKWCEALRSELYQQGTDRLKKRMPSGNITYCCLGVLCEIEGIPQSEANLSHVKAQQWADGALTVYQFGRENQTSMLEAGLVPQFDILDACGQLRGASVTIWESFEDKQNGEAHLGTFSALTELNDNGLTFNQIADIIDVCFTNID